MSAVLVFRHAIALLEKTGKFYNMPNQSKKSNINKKSKLIYVLIGVIAVIIVAIGIIFACATTTKTKEKTWTTEDSMRQSKIDQQESVAKQLYLKAKLEYTNTGAFPKELDDFVENTENIKNTLPNLQYTRYGNRGFVITYTNIDGETEKLIYTAGEDS